MLHYLISRRRFLPGVTDDALAQTVFHYRVGLAVYIAATVIAFIFPLASFALYGAIALYYLFPTGVDADKVGAETGNP